MPCYKKHKAFLIYSRLSTKEGLFTETTVKDQDVRFGKYNQDLYRECEWCYQVFEIEKAFKKNAFMCNKCYKLLQKEKIRDVNLLINVKTIELEKIFFNYIESLKTVC